MVLILVHSSTTCTLYTGKLTGIKLGVCFVLLSVNLFLKFCSLSNHQDDPLSPIYTCNNIFSNPISKS